MHCPGGNATDPIWRVLSSSEGISSWTPLKPQQSNPNPTLWPINSGLLTSLLLPHLSSSLTDSLSSLNLLCHSKTDARFMQDGRKAVRSNPYVSVSFFPSLKHNSIAYRSSKMSSCPDCIFEIHQLWQSCFSRVYSNCYCSCSFEPEIIKFSQSSHKMYSNKILNFQESTTILNACTKKVSKRIECTTHTHTHIYIYIYTYIRHHHYIMLLAWLSLTLSRHPSLSSIAPSKSPRLHPMSVQSCNWLGLVGRPTPARPCEVVHRRS